MGDAHERYEELAVGHVLGGLRSRDASVFRAHLAGCRECRMRVAELRGIAADLAAAEREELRMRTPVATDVNALEDPGDPPAPPRQRRSTTAVGLAVLAALVTLAAGLFWLTHLQRVGGQLRSVVATQDEALEILTLGDPVAVEVEGDVTVTASRRDGRLAVTLADLPTLAADELVVVWLLDGDEVTDRSVLADADLVRRRATLPFVLDADDAQTVVVSIERRGGAAPEAPGERLATIRPGS